MDLKTAMEHVSRRGPGMLEDRRVRLEVLERLASRLEGLRAATDECKSDCVKRIAAKSNVAWTAAVVDALGDSWQDESFTLKYAIGLEAMFETPDSGVYRADVQEPEVSPQDSAAGNARVVSRIANQPSVMRSRRVIAT